MADRDHVQASEQVPVQGLVQEVVLAQPRGFCAGVDRAIEIVERALQLYGAPIHVRHEIVHNTYVVNDLKAKGAIFIEDLAEVPAGATLIFSAHGVSKAVQDEARTRGFRIFDATCPLVTKVHVEVAKLSREGYEFLMIGHKGHPEVEGTMGQLHEGIYLVEDATDVARAPVKNPDRLAVVTQTTLSVDDAAAIHAAVKARFPNVREPKKQDICYATQNRQDAVKLLSGEADVVIVVGSPTSSNSNRLREVAERLGTPAYMIDSADELQPEWFAGLVHGACGADCGRLGPRAAGAAGDRPPQGPRRPERAQDARREEHTAFPLPMGLGDKSMAAAQQAVQEAAANPDPPRSQTQHWARPVRFSRTAPDTPSGNLPCSTSPNCAAT
jgi:4-hydroxy-3-methylbut-2-enyl diphosphate reductase